MFAAALRTNFSNPASAVQKKNPWAVIEELLHYSKTNRVQPDFSNKGIF